MTSKKSNINTSSNKRRSSTYKGQAQPTSNMFYLFPILFIVAVLPLIIRIKPYTTTFSEFSWFSSSNQFTDFFLIYKQWFFITITSFMAIIIAFKAYTDKRKLQFAPIYIPLAVYAVLSLMSSVASEYRSISFQGSFEQFESIFVVLGYCLIVYYVYLFIQTEEDVRWVIRGLLFCIIVFSIIGLTQITGHDFFASDTGLKLITPEAYWASLDTFTFKFGDRWVYLTLYNPNYVGVYVALVAPVLFMIMIFMKDFKKIWLFLVGLAGLIVCLIGSHSITGLLGIIFSAIVILILLWRYLLKYLYITIPVIVIGIIALFVVNGMNDNFIISKIARVIDMQKSTPNLTDIQTNNDELVIKYKDNTMKIRFTAQDTSNFQFDFYDETGSTITSNYTPDNAGTYTITDSRFQGFVVKPCIFNEFLSFSVTIDAKEWIFTNQSGDGTYYFFNQYGKMDKIITAPSVIFTGYESYATNRGYIWSRSIPVLKDTLILGSGADTFPIMFPQRDYVQANNFTFGSQFISKPHNFFIKMGVESGVIALIAILIFYGWYFVTSIGLYIRGRFTSYYAQVGAGIFVGTLAFMFTGISNDSCIAVTPIFYLLIGLGIAVNFKAKPFIMEEALNAKQTNVI